MTLPWYIVHEAELIASPALLVYPDRVRENLRRIIEIAGGTDNLRPHVKTHKMAEVVTMQRASGIDKFKCATVAEAEMLAKAGAADILLGYPMIGPSIERFAQLIETFPETVFSTIADDSRQIAAISDRFASANKTVAVLLDIDNGMNRSGIIPGPEALNLYAQIDRLPGLTCGGLHVYDGHIRQPNIAERKEACDAAIGPVLRFRDELLQAGHPVPNLIAGGTPSFSIHAGREGWQCSPGTCIFWDVSYREKFPDLEFLHAALLLTRVISRPGKDRLCLDLGYKAISSDNPDPRVELMGLSEARMVNHSEEHLVVESSNAGSFQVGDVLYGIPYHVCPTVALHAEAIVIDDHHRTGTWRVAARDRKLTI